MSKTTKNKCAIMEHKNKPAPKKSKHRAAPDGNILALCEELNAMERELIAASKGPADEPGDAVWKKNKPRRDEIINELWKMPRAAIARQARALARSIGVFSPGVMHGPLQDMGAVDAELSILLLRALAA